MSGAIPPLPNKPSWRGALPSPLLVDFVYLNMFFEVHSVEKKDSNVCLLVGLHISSQNPLNRFV